LNEAFHIYSSCEWQLLRRFSRSQVKGQGSYMCKCVNATTVEAHASTVCYRDSLVSHIQTSIQWRWKQIRIGMASLPFPPFPPFPFPSFLLPFSAPLPLLPSPLFPPPLPSHPPPFPPSPSLPLSFSFPSLPFP